MRERLKIREGAWISLRFIRATVGYRFFPHTSASRLNGPPPAKTR